MVGESRLFATLGKTTKFTYEYVREYFMKEGCILLSNEYINANTHLHYVCNCGNSSRITFSQFRMGKRCRSCGGQKNSKRFRFSFEYVKKYFEDRGCVLLEEIYINNIQPLKYICLCGEQSVISFSSFKIGARCKRCGIIKQSRSKSTSLEEIKSYFKSNGCVLLEEQYINRNQELRYICSCGKETKKTYANAKRSYKCELCIQELKGGENHYNWQEGKTTIHLYLRNINSRWKEESLKYHNYTCMITGENKNLDIHHTYPFHKILQETIKELNFPIYKTIGEYSKEQLSQVESKLFEIQSKYGFGAVIIRKYHHEFHKTHDKYDFTPEDFELFKEKKIKEMEMK